MATLKHQVIDDISADKLFTIDPVTRQITNEGGKKQNLIQYDHNSERFTFVIPDTVEGHDMTKCDSIQIHAVNTDEKTRQVSRELYLIDIENDLIHDTTNHTISFTWLISDRCTQYVGALCFLVKFICTDENDPSKNIYVWNTAPCNTFKILSGLRNNEELVVEYADVLNKMQEALNRASIVNLTAAESSEDGGDNVWTATLANGTTKTLTVKNGKQGETGETGKSAYDIAKDTGATTAETEKEWAESLTPPQFFNGSDRLKSVIFMISGSDFLINTQS